FQAEDGIRDFHVTGVQTCALPISDKRFNALKLTSAGQAKYERVNERMARQQAAFLEPFSEAERTQLFSYLNRLHSHLADRHAQRSEERRVGQECRSWWAPDEAKEE